MYWMQLLQEVLWSSTTARPRAKEQQPAWRATVVLATTIQQYLSCCGRGRWLPGVDLQKHQSFNWFSGGIFAGNGSQSGTSSSSVS